ncbi:hypothetical protein ACHAWC_010448 [Mediolabrus comicus]
MKRTTTPPRRHATEIGMASFQEARLAEQLRFRISEGKRQEELVAAAASAAEEARNLLAIEEQLIDDGKFIPEAPMMTYQKYLTMQEKRVKVTIRYSSSAGLRPFYLTVADQIKSYHPDVLLERRILPKVGSDAGGGEAVFEVLVDGKIVIGKKKTMFLKVSSKSSSSSDKGETDDNDKRSDKNNQSGEINFAGGRSIFVSMEKLEQELVKARKKRRPSTMYKNKEDALRGATSGGGDGDGIIVAADGAESEATQQQFETAQRGQAMTDAVLRLEKLKAMSANKRKL